MSVVVQPPFWAEDEDDVAAHFNVTAPDHQPARCRHDLRAFLRKNIHALVSDGLAPGIVPEGVGVVVIGGGTGDGHGDGLG